MKRLLLLTAVFLSIASAAFAGGGDKPHYNIKIKIKGLKDTMVQLAYYMGDNTYLIDSARMDSKGVVVFSRDTTLDCGIYLLAVNKAKMFEFIVSETDFSLETDTSNIMMNMKVKGSKQNELFFEFNQHTYKIGLEEERMKKQAQEWALDLSKKDTLAKLNEAIKNIPQQVYNYRTEFMKNNPDAVLTTLFNALTEPQVPEAPKDANGNIIDSNWQYAYYIDHYWDNVNFASGCILRTPVYHTKLMRYMEKATFQHPDSLYQSAVKVIEKTRADKETFRYTVMKLVNKYTESPYICMDGIPVRLAVKYYTYKDCFWLDSTEIARTRANAESYLPTLCYLQAPPLKMYDSTLERKIDKIIETDTNEQSRGIKLGILLNQEKSTNLYDVKAKYTVVVFWDPDCGHCKKEMPVIKSFYDSVKPLGVEVYAVGVEQDAKKWIQYIRDNQLKWINVTDSWNLSDFRKYYNINSTPQIFLLDKDKKIIAKRLGAEQLKEILYHELGLPYTAPPKKDGDKDDGHGH
jgi:thiol-disulfide isomerase/thioredoxin